MTFIHHKNGKKERLLPVDGETLIIKVKNNEIKVKSDLLKEDSDYNKPVNND